MLPGSCGSVRIRSRIAASPAPGCMPARKPGSAVYASHPQPSMLSDTIGSYAMVALPTAEKQPLQGHTPCLRSSLGSLYHPGAASGLLGTCRRGVPAIRYRWQLRFSCSQSCELLPRTILVFACANGIERQEKPVPESTAHIAWRVFISHDIGFPSRPQCGKRGKTGTLQSPGLQTCGLHAPAESDKMEISS